MLKLDGNQSVSKFDVIFGRMYSLRFHFLGERPVFMTGKITKYSVMSEEHGKKSGRNDVFPLSFKKEVVEVIYKDGKRKIQGIEKAIYSKFGVH